MAKSAFFLLGLVALSTAYCADQTVCVTLADLQNFTKGVLDGLETNPSKPGACYQGFTTFNTDVDKVIVEAQKLLDGDFSGLSQLTTDLNAAIAQLKSLETPCDFADLVAKVKVLAGPDGKSILISNYLKHALAINKDLDEIKNCSADTYTCGKAVGNAVKNLVGYTITSPRYFLA